MPCPQCASHNGNLKITMWVPFPPRVNNRPRLQLTEKHSVTVFFSEFKAGTVIGGFWNGPKPALTHNGQYNAEWKTASNRLIQWVGWKRWGSFTSNQSVQENVLFYSRQLQKNISMPVCNRPVDFIVALVFLQLHYEWCRAAKTCGTLLLWR